MANPPKSLPPEVIDALRRGNKIEAIRRLRTATHLGLAEAKDQVDEYELETAADRPMSSNAASSAVRVPYATATPRDPKLSPGEVPRTSHGLTLVMLIVAAAIVGWLYARFG
jgi:hypothetical protein